MSLTFEDITKIRTLIQHETADLRIDVEQLKQGQLMIQKDLAIVKDMILELTAFVKHESAASYARLEDHEHRIINLEKTI